MGTTTPSTTTTVTTTTASTTKTTSVNIITEPFPEFGVVSESKYHYIDVASLEPQSFVICVGECKDEGFWMMIAFVSTAGFCLLTGGLSCLGSRRIRQGASVFNSLLLLGLIGGLIYVGVVEKVNWKITGGFI